MINIDKYKINNYDCFDIVTDDGCFRIWFCGNLDLYWSYKYTGNILNTSDSKDFYITKENYFLYSLFDELYSDVKEYNIFLPNNYNTEDECLANRERFREKDLYNPRKLFRDGKIDWHCDDFDYDEGSSLVIEKLDDCYKLTFVKSKCDDYIYSKTYSVRIRNSGSRYGYFNMVFMRMYNKLREYEPNFHQIHVEEFLYHKKLVKEKRD